MQDNIIPLIGEPKLPLLKLEIPAMFSVKLLFINHQGQYTSVDFNLPPGVYPNPQWLEKVIKDAYRTSLTTLKVSTKDLSWRKCTPTEFVSATAGGAKVNVDLKWHDAYSFTMDVQVPEIDREEVVDEQTGTP